MVVSIAAFLFLTFGVSRMASISTIDPSSFWLMTILTCAIVFFNNLNTGMLALPQADQRFDIYNKRVLIIGTTNTLGLAAISYFFKSPSYLFTAQLISQMITFFSLFIYTRQSLKGISFEFNLDKEYKSKLFNFGLRQFIGNIASQINFYSSRFIIGSQLPASSITSFGVPQNLIGKAAGGISQMTLALFPMGTALSTKERLPKLRRLIWSLQLAIFFLGLLGIFVIYQFGLIILTWWLRNPELANTAYPILKILSWYFAIAILTPIPTAMSESLNYPQVPSFFAVLTTITTIILLLVFIPLYGIVGAAYAYLLCHSLYITRPRLNHYQHKDL
jgi:O-antigen/teichoic acid export membrane protein